MYSMCTLYEIKVYICSVEYNIVYNIVNTTQIYEYYFTKENGNEKNFDTLPE